MSVHMEQLGQTGRIFMKFVIWVLLETNNNTYLLTYLLHGAESFLRS